MAASTEPSGLTARLDKLVYHHGGKCLPADQPHAFVYFITIHNATEHTIRLLGRKWVISRGDGTCQVIEGEGIVGETPVLPPGESFSYNSYHVTAGDATVQGCFHGVDEAGNAVRVRLDSFALRVPQAED